MAVMVPRENWTDQQLDDLNEKVDEGFARVDADIRELRSEIKGLGVEMATRFESLQRALLSAAIAIIVTLIGCCTSLVGVAVL